MSMTGVKERMKGSLREKMTKMRVRVTGELLWGKVQEARGMVITVLSSF